MENIWKLDLNHWNELKEDSEEYSELKQMLLFGEGIAIRDSDGGICGYLTLCEFGKVKLEESHRD